MFRLIKAVGVASILTMGSMHAATVTITFEAPQGGDPLEDFEGVNTYYAGGFGSLGSGPGPDFGVTFNNTAIALIDRDAGGSGGFGGEPSPDTVMFIAGAPLSTGTAVMDVSGGFEGGISFFYSMPGEFDLGFVSIYDQAGGSAGGGNLLGYVELVPTPYDGAPDPTGVASPLVPLGTSFNGIGRSVEFLGPVENVVFDDISFSPRVPIPAVPEVASTVPTIMAGLLLLAAAAAFAQESRSASRRPAR